MLKFSVLTYRHENDQVFPQFVNFIPLFFNDHVYDESFDKWHDYITSRTCKEPNSAAEYPSFEVPSILAKLLKGLALLLCRPMIFFLLLSLFLFRSKNFLLFCSFCLFIGLFFRFNKVTLCVNVFELYFRFFRSRLFLVVFCLLHLNVREFSSFDRNYNEFIT